MEWLEITLQTASSGTEAAAAALTAAGFDQLVIEDQAEFEDFLEQNRACWDYIDETLQKKLQGMARIRLYLEREDRAGLARVKALAEALGLPMTASPLADGDWAESWKENYPPQPVGDRLLILPDWLADTDTGGRLPVILDPGLAFGTGYHPSTRMVLEVMEKRLRPGDRCLDLGSGSGILSIAALRLGAASAAGLDIDPKAAEAASANAALNGFYPPAFTAGTGDAAADRALADRLGQFDLVFVNIVADVIIRLAPTLPRLLKESGTVICSGILAERLDEVRAALTGAGLAVLGTAAEEDWRCVWAKRSGL